MPRIPTPTLELVGNAALGSDRSFGLTHVVGLHLVEDGGGFGKSARVGIGDVSLVEALGGISRKEDGERDDGKTDLDDFHDFQCAPLALALG